MQQLLLVTIRQGLLARAQTVARARAGDADLADSPDASPLASHHGATPSTHHLRGVARALMLRAQQRHVPEITAVVRCLQLRCCGTGNGVGTLRRALLDTLYQLRFAQGGGETVLGSGVDLGFGVHFTTHSPSPHLHPDPHLPPPIFTLNPTPTPTGPHPPCSANPTQPDL